MKIHLTKGELSNMISEQVNFHYDDEQIKGMINDVDKMIMEVEKVIGVYMSKFINTRVVDIMDNPSGYSELVNGIRGGYENMYKRYSKIDDIQVGMDDDERIVRILGDKLSDLNLVLDEFDNVRDVYEELVELIIKNGEVSDKIKRLSGYIRNIDIK